jgi:hypothetical protein
MNHNHGKIKLPSEAYPSYTWPIVCSWSGSNSVLEAIQLGLRLQVRPHQINLLLHRFAGLDFALLEKNMRGVDPLPNQLAELRSCMQLDGWTLMASACLLLVSLLSSITRFLAHQTFM